jgi:hypothetical protein
MNKYNNSKIIYSTIGIPGFVTWVQTSGDLKWTKNTNSTTFSNQPGAQTTSNYLFASIKF